MSEYAQQIKSDLDIFQMSVQRLSSGIRAAAGIWRDPKYAELSAEMTRIANQSRDVLVTGDKCCSAIDRFFDIAAQEY